MHPPRMAHTSEAPQLLPVQAAGAEGPESPLEEAEIRVTSLQYGSVMDAIESDHKPVVAMLRVNMPVTDQASP